MFACESGAHPWSIIEAGQPYTMNLYSLLAAAVGGEIIDLVGETGPVAKVVLLILLIFSLISWSIILSKWSLLRRARVQSGRFVRAFRKAQRLQDVSAVADQFRPSPLVGVFEGGFEEYRRQGAVASGADTQPARGATRHADCQLRGVDPLRTQSAVACDHRRRSRRLSACSERYGASLMLSTVWAPRAPPPCARSLPEFPKP